MDTIRDAYSVWWADLRIMRRLWPQFLLTSVMSPLLYLVAFGYGLGHGMTVNGVDYLEFVIPGIIALTAMNTSFTAAGVKLNIDRLFFHSFDEMLMSPVSPTSLVLGKSMIGVVRGLIVCLLFVALGVGISSIRITPLFLVSLLVTCLMFALIGVLCAMYAESHQGMSTLTTLILTPMSFLGGTFFALDHVPQWVKVAIYALPLTYSSFCLRAEALGDSFPWTSFAVMGAVTVATFALGVRAVRRSSD